MTVAAMKALDLADALRQGRGLAAPFDLWLAAQRESERRRPVRLQLFRHAMFHAGYTTTSKGVCYRRCPQCHGTLAR